MEITEVEMGPVRREDGASTSTEDVRRLTDRIRRVFENLEQRPRKSECCIYRVRESLRKLNEEAYTPRVISIGPFHRGKKELQTMEKNKERYLYGFLQRNMTISLEDMVTSIKEMEERVRHCYSEIIELSSDELVMMILLDGGFIVEYFLRRLSYMGRDSENVETLYKPYFVEDIIMDLILLENQLPFFVLENLYNLVIPPTNVAISFAVIAQYSFSSYNKQGISIERQADLHFTDMVRTFHLPSSLMLPPERDLMLPPEGDLMLRPEGDEKCQYSLSAMELHEAGVKFEINSSSQCLFDVQFTNGVLQIPHFIIEDNTESLFRNLMALEQCCYPDQTYICDYINLMDTLINTAKDVELLVQNRIIRNWLGDHNAVAILFNHLCLRITVGGLSYFSKLENDLNEYYKNPWHNWKATLKRDYFSSPWRIASTVAAFILLALTFMQTMNSFISL